MKPQEVETIKYDFKRVLKPLCNIILVPTSSRLFEKFISAHNPFNALTLSRSCTYAFGSGLDKRSEKVEMIFFK